MKKVSLIALALCIILSLPACTDYESQIEELQTTISDNEDTIEELELQVSDYESQLKDAADLIAQHEATIDDLNKQLDNAEASADESYTEVSNTNVNESEYVYVTRTGSKYHQIWCSYLSNSCLSMTLDDALSAGYDACSRCY
jgi:peptidoglycan hydrolase CwlO-like protein